LRFSVNGETISHAPGTMLGSRAFVNQQPLFTPNSVHDDPTNAEFYLAYDSIAILAAPITADRTRLGVLIVYAPRAPIFAEDDLALVQLLADQAAVILESRTLIDEATGVRAREEAARLKNDFLSAAAHDLKTPLTTLIAQAQLLQRRAVQRPEAPVDVAGVERIEREANRLRALVLELLDAARVEQDKLVTSVDRVDLAELAREVCGRQTSERHRCTVEAAKPVVGEYDRNRLLQLLENLVENAIKYSPAGGDVLITVVIRTDEALLTVSDTGIGIPPPDLPRVFDRFHRGANVDDRRFAGMGLGLFICRGIVEQHGGRIWVTSTPGRGSTFHVTLPVMTAVVAA
jgi:signal transduction histidine kinase